MDELFSTELTINSQQVRYRVIFEEEQYAFVPETDEEQSTAFSIRREADEWHEQGQLPPEIKTQAVNALEQYLLQQH